jgi:hypothetical protein
MKAVLDIKVFHLPAIHTSHKADAFLLSKVIVFQHGVHDVAQMVNDGLYRCLIGKVPRWPHIEHVMTALGFEARDREKCLVVVARRAS